ncbi:class I SAM-dependent methyltransferase [Pseudoalteromonas sp. SMS1]|uniref:class I SAM-dependent methyltransferase n=1 Tax=Pseudoalteromonas sp. SMS1 TaxID=2908894 RepID=UPI001F19792A|nr:class I SAM-dependent methyltransferase [Pseudoalteromonas sp. SMS1]MCF2858484.1 class I SAM-dependent methyltransferase [Pseudoalteromonas sp. SMS1]
MSTDWMIEEVSHQFDFYDDYLENQLGYQPLIDDLIARLGTQISVLDYGCGGGKVSRRLVARGIEQVTGVDISNVMIDKASTHADRGNSRYQQVTSGELPFDDASFNAAVCCYVFINNDEKAELLKIAKEAHRAIQSGGYFYILDTNPDSTGVKFSNFKNGDADVEYQDGDKRPVYLDLPDGNVFKIIDTHWDKQTYISVLREAGFESIDVVERIELEQLSGKHWAPFVLFRCKKS